MIRLAVHLFLLEYFLIVWVVAKKRFLWLAFAIFFFCWLLLYFWLKNNFFCWLLQYFWLKNNFFCWLLIYFWLKNNFFCWLLLYFCYISIYFEELFSFCSCWFWINLILLFLQSSPDKSEILTHPSFISTKFPWILYIWSLWITGRLWSVYILVNLSIRRSVP